MTRAAAIVLVGATLALAGCAYPKNPQLDRVDSCTGYRFNNLTQNDPRNTDDTFIILTFSGGGTRAAALAYGVLEHLRQTPIDGGRKRLLDEVDVISSVSGGSFTAAYYGLFGEQQFFEKFKDAVLHRRIETDLILRILAPWNWPRLLSPWFGRSDLADEYYDRNIFEGRTYAAMPLRRPFIILNATDISLGAQFSFTQDDFDRLCSNLSGVHVSRGVTASSAFPVAFTPLTLKNYPKDACHYTAPDWVGLALRDFTVNPSRYNRAVTWRSYENAAHRPFIHLSDGGLADNIGLRGPEVAINSDDPSWSLLRMVDKVKHLAVIAVDAKPEDPTTLDRYARPPGIYSVLNAAATNPMENYSSDTIELLRTGFKAWDTDACNFARRQQKMSHSCDALAAEQCAHSHEHGCIERHRRECKAQFVPPESDRLPHPDLYRVHVQFAALKDETLRQRLEQIPTALQLSTEDVELLINAAGTLLEQSDDYRRLRYDLGGESTPGDPALRPRCPLE
jgi:NTE family protein